MSMQVTEKKLGGGTEEAVSFTIHSPAPPPLKSSYKGLCKNESASLGNPRKPRSSIFLFEYSLPEWFA